MELPVVSALEFDQVRSSIKNFIKNKTDFQDYNFEGSNLSMLVDILSYNTLYTTYNLNMSVNELNLDTAVLRDNIVSIAKRLGYAPTSYTSSKVNLNLTINNLGGQYDYVRIDRGSVLSASYNSKNYRFLLRDKIEVNARDKDSVSLTNIELSEGAEFAITYVVDETNEHQRFFVPNNFIDATSIRAFVITDPTNNVEVEYTRKETIVDIQPSDTVFFVEEVQDQKYEVIFGDDVIGRKVRNGEIIKIQYVITNGDAANGITQFKLVGKIRGIVNNTDNLIGYSNIQYSLSSDKSDGGSIFESARSIKFRAPRYYAAQERAVTVSDYESLIQKIYANTDLVRVTAGETLSPPKFGKVFVSIKPSVGETVSTGEKQRILRELVKYKVGSVDVEVLDPTSIIFKIKPLLAFETSKTRNRSTELESSVNEVITNYAKELSFDKFGGKYSDLELQSRLSDIDPAINLVQTAVVMQQKVTLEPGVEKKYLTDFYTELNDNVSDKYYMISEPFCHKGISTPVFLATPTIGNPIDVADPNCLTKDDNIYLITTDGVVVKSVGTLDPETGSLDYTIQPCDDTQPTDINIFVIPEVTEVTVGPEVVPEIIIDPPIIEPDFPGTVILDPDGPFLDIPSIISDPPPGDPNAGEYDDTDPDGGVITITPGPGGGTIDVPVITPGDPGTPPFVDPEISDPNDYETIEDYTPETDPYSCS